MKILFADDDIKYALIIKRYLEAEGFEVTYAGNGRIALELYAQTKPDLVLLDINMPEVNGFEVAKEIRRHDARTLIFFLTDRTDKRDRLEGFSLRANDYLAKPFYPEELIARINERFGVQLGGSGQQYLIGQTTFDYPANEIRTHSCRRMITSRQSEILKMLADNAGTPVNRQALLTAVWGDDSYANSLALNVQIALIRQALKSDPTIEVKTLPKRGYMLREVK